MPRPVIGIPAAVETVRFGPWEEPASFLPVAYADAVRRGGGLPLLLVPEPGPEDPDEILDLLDGLLLAGGADVDPGSYGAAPHPQTRGTTPARDAYEIALTRRALARDMPVLAICRGMQLLNVAAGGTLHQHLPDLVGTDEHRRHLGRWPGAGGLRGPHSAGCCTGLCGAGGSELCRRRSPVHPQVGGNPQRAGEIDVPGADSH